LSTLVFAILWLGSSIGLPTTAQHQHTGHRTAKHNAHSTDDKKMNALMVGMSAAEQKYLRGHLAKMSPSHRPMMMDHMTKMSPKARRKTVQQMMKDGGKGGGMHGAGNRDHHGAHSRSGGHVHPSDQSGGVKSGSTQEPARLAVGARVPDFEVRDLQGRTLRLSDLRKRTKSGIVSLTFWCSFCHSCRDVEKRLDRFAQDYKDQAVVAALDASAGETTAAVTAFAKKTRLTLPILMDAPGKAADLFGVKVTTTTIMIDGQGILRYRGQFLEGDQMRAKDALQAVLAGRPVTVQETSLQG
jgi:peroxiredoxin